MTQDSPNTATQIRTSDLSICKAQLSNLALEHCNDDGTFKPVFFPQGCQDRFPWRRSRRLKYSKLKRRDGDHGSVGAANGTVKSCNATSNSTNNNEEKSIEPKDALSPAQTGAKLSWADRAKANAEKESSHKRTVSTSASPSSASASASPVSQHQRTNSVSKENAQSPEVNQASIITPKGPPASARKEPLGKAIQRYSHGGLMCGHELCSRGLVNGFNICFMNSILQALVHCTPFYKLMEFIEQETMSAVVSKTPIVDGLISLIRDMKQVQGDNEEGKSQAPISPDAFYTVLSNHPKFKHLQRGRQEDAEEFLGYLLEAMHEEFAQALKDSGAPLAKPEEDDNQENNKDEDDWTEVGKDSKPVVARLSGSTDETPISRLFGGKFKSVLRSPGKKVSVTVDPFQHVQLGISDEEVSSIEDAFRLVSRPEDVQYQMTDNKQVVSKRTVYFSKLPPVLIVHLKRFTFVQGAETALKNSKRINYSTKLDIPPECISNNDDLSKKTGYSLIGVVHHHGQSAQAGHYTVDVKNGSRWIHIDDTSVERCRLKDYVDGKEMESQTAYLLFYVRNRA